MPTIGISTITNRAAGDQYVGQSRNIEKWWKSHRGRSQNSIFGKRKPLTFHVEKVSGLWSGREDLNLRPLAPHASALAGLRHAPRDRIIADILARRQVSRAFGCD